MPWSARRSETLSARSTRPPSPHVESLLRCGDLASGFTRLQCPDCGHERLLAFTCKGRHFCPSCHKRRVRSTSDWIATAVCHEVPHRQFAFTIPKVLRGIFRKRRRLLTHLFHTATETLRDAFRIRLKLPDGKLGAIAAVHTFGDYLIFHPHLHVLAADGLFAPDNRFHCMPVEDLALTIELFRHRFLHALRESKLISRKKLADLLAWKHSGFHIHDGGKKPVPAPFQGEPGISLPNHRRPSQRNTSSAPLFPRTPLSPPSGAAQRLFQGPPAKSKFLQRTSSRPTKAFAKHRRIVSVSPARNENIACRP